MQTDTWLTDTAYPDRCPLCSGQLADGSNTCPSCGFTAHEPASSSALPARPSASGRSNPLTPIPARASAQRIQSRPPARPRLDPVDADSSSAQQGAGWQHESSSYEAASSLSSLSLIISETPTAPPRSPRQQRAAGEDIEEIDTVPQASGQTRAVQWSSGQVQTVPRSPRLQQAAGGDIEEIDTVPQASGQTRAVQRSSGQTQAIPPAEVMPEPPGSLSLRFDDLEIPGLAVVLSETTPPVLVPHVDEIDTVPEAGSTPSRAILPLPSEERRDAVDALSWTAGPGSSGSLAARFLASRAPRRRGRTFSPLDRTRWWLLRPGHIEFLLWTFGALLLFGVTFLILLATVLSMMVPGLQAGSHLPVSAVKTSAASPVETSVASGSLHLTLVGKHALAPGAEVQLQGTDFRARSKVVFLLDGRLSLLDQHGQAASVQTDVAGRFTVNVWLGQGPAWSAGTHRILARDAADGNQIAVPITITAATTTPASGSGVQNTPVSPVNPVQTPVSPTPTPVVPAPTPTAATTPTVGTTPPPAGAATVTPVAPASTATPAQGQAPGSSSLGNSLNSEDSPSLFARLASLNPLVWFIGVCYFCSMLLLGIAGLLRYRHR